MGYGGQRVVEDIIYTFHQCQHCGDWLNDKGFVDLEATPKLKTAKGVYCKFCKTAAQRRAMDEENKKLFQKNERT